MTYTGAVAFSYPSGTDNSVIIYRPARWLKILIRPLLSVFAFSATTFSLPEFATRTILNSVLGILLPLLDFLFRFKVSVLPLPPPPYVHWLVLVSSVVVSITLPSLPPVNVTVFEIVTKPMTSSSNLVE